MPLTPEAIFGLLAVLIMLFPTSLFLIRWLHRRCSYISWPRRHHRDIPALVQQQRLPPFTHHHHQAFHDVEMQVQYGYPQYSCDGASATTDLVPGEWAVDDRMEQQYRVYTLVMRSMSWTRARSW